MRPLTSVDLDVRTVTWGSDGCVRDGRLATERACMMKSSAFRLCGPREALGLRGALVGRTTCAAGASVGGARLAPKHHCRRAISDTRLSAQPTPRRACADILGVKLSGSPGRHAWPRMARHPVDMHTAAWQRHPADAAAPRHWPTWRSGYLPLGESWGLAGRLRPDRGSGAAKRRRPTRQRRDALGVGRLLLRLGVIPACSCRLDQTLAE